MPSTHNPTQNVCICVQFTTRHAQVFILSFAFIACNRIAIKKKIQKFEINIIVAVDMFADVCVCLSAGSDNCTHRTDTFLNGKYTRSTYLWMCANARVMWHHDATLKSCESRLVRVPTSTPYSMRRFLNRLFIYLFVPHSASTQQRTNCVWRMAWMCVRICKYIQDAIHWLSMCVCVRVRALVNSSLQIPT